MFVVATPYCDADDIPLARRIGKWWREQTRAHTRTSDGPGVVLCAEAQPVVGGGRQEREGVLALAVALPTRAADVALVARDGARGVVVVHVRAPGARQ